LSIVRQNLAKRRPDQFRNTFNQQVSVRAAMRSKSDESTSARSDSSTEGTRASLMQPAPRGQLTTN
jgi:hypothetical protein